ncbi:MAG: type II secretion system protein [Alphaproteobacteria bacterium]
MKAERLHSKGFTLIELSIVLLIIGLIVSSVLAAHALIIAAGVRATISQKERFDLAAQTFRAKYNCLPGDCANATSLGFTGNGNGDGWVGTANIATSPSNEIANFFTHIIADGLLSQTDTALKINASLNSRWSMWCEEGQYSGAFQRVYPEWDTRNSYSISDGNLNDGGVGAPLRPELAQAIDLKIDDGLPTTGSTRATGGYNMSGAGDLCQPYLYTNFIGAGGASSDFCISNSSTPNPYNVMGENTSCYLIIKSAF